MKATAVSRVQMLMLSLIVGAGTVFTFQNCAQPNQIDLTSTASTSTGGFSASYTPTTVAPSTLVTINVSGCTAPFTYTKVKVHGSLSSYVILHPMHPNMFVWT